MSVAKENTLYVDAQVFEILFWNYGYVIYDIIFAQTMEMKKYNLLF